MKNEEGISIDDVKYIEEKRDIELDRFVSDVKLGVSVDLVEKRYKTLMRLQKQMRLMEDTLIIHRLAKSGSLPGQNNK